MIVDVIVDTVCPWCYVGMVRLEKALAMRPDQVVEIGWRSFQLNPTMPPEGKGDMLSASDIGKVKAWIAAGGKF